MNELFTEGFEKVAKSSGDSKPGYWDTQKAIVRAATDSEGKSKGSSYVGIANKKLIKSRFKEGGKTGLKGAAGVGAAGAAAGALAGGKGKRGKSALLGAGIGAAAGFLGGNAVGSRRADYKYLKDKGISTKWHGFGTKMTPEAKKKYIDKYK